MGTRLQIVSVGSYFLYVIKHNSSFIDFYYFSVRFPYTSKMMNENVCALGSTAFYIHYLVQGYLEEALRYGVQITLHHQGYGK